MAAKQEIDGGWIFKTWGLISVEIFSDFLEMSDQLLDAGYKEAAAVMIGAVLEEHLRGLSTRNGNAITITNRHGRTEPKKAAVLNDELKGISIYNAIDHRNIGAWLTLRNNAAHITTVTFDIAQVRLMRDGVSNFIARVN